MSTKIQWTDETWNPTTGCTRVSEGCRNCYIERTPAFRINKRKFVNGSTGVLLHPDRLEAPLHWKKPRRVFVNSLSDLFHEDVPDEFIDRVFAVMALAHQHTFQILTKRPERMLSYCGTIQKNCRWLEMEDIARSLGRHPRGADNDGFDWISNHQFLPNVWLGVSIEDQQTADERIPILLNTPAAVRFISGEPLLSYVNIERHLRCQNCGYSRLDQQIHGDHRLCPRPTPWLDWAILGGESGPGARPCDLAWIRSIKDQCEKAGVKVFIKQLGRRAHSERDFIAYPRMRQGMAMDGYYRFLKDQKGGDISEFPSDLQVREWPR